MICPLDPVSTAGRDGAVPAVLFDLDGTLVHTAPDIAAAINRMLTELDKPTYPVDRILEWVGEGAPRLVQRALTGGLEEPAAPEADHGLVLFQQHYANAVCVHSRPYPHARRTLAVLREAGTALGCVTNKPEHLTRMLLDTLDMSRCFDVVIGGDTLEHRKPHPLPLRRACRDLNVDVSDAVYVGDSMTDCRAAEAARIPMVAVTWGYNRGADLTKASCAAIIDSFDELPRVLKSGLRRE